MNVDAIVDKILSDARQSAQDALKAAEEKADAIKERSAEAVRLSTEKAREQTDAEISEAKRLMRRMAELDLRKEELRQKRVVIDEAFAKALKMMDAMPAETAREYMLKLCVESARGCESVISDKSNELINQAFVDDANAALKAAGKPATLTLGEKRLGVGCGFLLGMDGMEINCTFASILNSARPSLEGDVARALFDDKTN
ncbi:MAG: V-type ATP synthase subunit E [Eubacteriales bacterium]|nr:V-type ATP synthase subunit E [Eubacteriales bacterium]MDD3882190.1 V-type ATP synthase subunit E [Eubacteriales bacterium]MDD4512539.1 V-type ATP synthase subunit E [Eubacteriales bacterium]